MTLVPEGRVLFILQFAIEILKDLARTYICSLRGTKPLLMHGSVMSLVDVHGVIYICTEECSSSPAYSDFPTPSLYSVYFDEGHNIMVETSVMVINLNYVGVLEFEIYVTLR